MAVIGSLSVKLGLVTVEWSQATTKAKAEAKALQAAFNDLTGGVKKVGELIKTLGGGFGLTAIGLGALMQQTLAYSNEVKDLSDGLGISIAKTLQFKDAIQTSGGNAEQATKMLSTLYAKIYDAQHGNEAAISQFEQLGISLKELSGLSNEQAITRVFDAIGNGTTDNYQKVKALKEMLGKGGLGLSVQEIADKLHMSLGAYKQYEASIAKAGEVSDHLKTTLDNLKIAFADMISPFASGGLVTIEQFKGIMVALGSYAVVSGLSKFALALLESGKGLRIAAAGEAAFLAMSGAGAAALVAGLIAYKIAVNEFEKQSANAPTAGDAVLTPEQIKANQEQAEKNRREIYAGDAKVKLAKQLLDIERQRDDNKVNDLTYDKFAIEMADNKLTLETELAQAVEKRASALNKENQSLAEKGIVQAQYNADVKAANQKSEDGVKLINAQYQQQIDLIHQKADVEKTSWMLELDRSRLDQNKRDMSNYDYQMALEKLDSLKRIKALEQEIVDVKTKLGTGVFQFKQADEEEARIRKMIDYEKSLSDARLQSLAVEEFRRTNFNEGWKEAYRKYVEDSQNAGQMGADAFNSLTSNMETALNNFVETGKLAFKDLIGSMIKDLIKLQLKAQATSLFSGLLSKMGLESLFGGTSMLDTSVVDAGGVLSGGISGYADGGSPPVGVASLVGERGPEMFIPKTAGTIIPNNTLASMGNSQPQTVYNGTVIQNMSAIDTQSGVQFLAKNKNAIFAANQSAQRGLPQSR